MPRVEFHPATPERWSDVEQLFGPRGACAGCWCMWPRLRGGEFAKGRGEPNKLALRKLVKSGAEPGIVVYVDGVPAGWCALAPRETYARIMHSRLFREFQETPAWSVVCFFVAREHRGSGLTRKLLEAAGRYAKQHGVKLLEGYPVEPSSGRTADAFVWTGLASTFRAAGFEEIARPSKTRPLMRKTLGGGRAKAAGSPAMTKTVRARTTTARATTPGRPRSSSPAATPRKAPARRTKKSARG